MTLRSRSRVGVVAALVVAAPLGLLALAGCTSSAGHPAAAADSSKYGELPSFLPKDSLQPDRALTGTIGKPALTVEGDSVDAKFVSGEATVTVTGPEVPGEGLPYQAAATTCTWTVTIRATSGKVGVSAAAFSTLDHLGAINHPEFVAGQPVPPTTLSPGQKVTFELRATMTVGEGLLRWAPDGTHIVSAWDFEVEND